MNINIEKISNGFVLTLGGKRVFCDVPEAVCGELAQWALAECESAKRIHYGQSEICPGVDVPSAGNGGATPDG